MKFKDLIKNIPNETAWWMKSPSHLDIDVADPANQLAIQGIEMNENVIENAGKLCVNLLQALVDSYYPEAKATVQYDIDKALVISIIYIGQDNLKRFFWFKIHPLDLETARSTRCMIEVRCSNAFDSFRRQPHFAPVE